jgi:hypothetical protein
MARGTDAPRRAEAMSARSPWIALERVSNLGTEIG